MADEYREASLGIWEQMAAAWEDDRRWVWESSRPVGEWLVQALDPQPGETILELAAGVGDTGLAAAERLGPDGRLISTDFSGPMVDAARRRAEELGVSMADPAAALRETRRVLRPGGRVALSVWGDPAANPWASVPAAAYLEHTGADPPDPRAPGIFAMAREERTRKLLATTGLEPVRMEQVEMAWLFETADEHWHYVMDHAGALAMLIRALPDDQAAVRRLTEERLDTVVQPPGYRLPGVCLQVLAR